MSVSMYLAAHGSPVFNVAAISNFLGSVLGLGLTAAGAFATFRALGQQAHRHVMSMAAVAGVGMVIAGISLAGMTSHVATGLAHLVLH